MPGLVAGHRGAGQVAPARFEATTAVVGQDRGGPCLRPARARMRCSRNRTAALSSSPELPRELCRNGAEPKQRRMPLSAQFVMSARGGSPSGTLFEPPGQTRSFSITNRPTTQSLDDMSHPVGRGSFGHAACADGGLSRTRSARAIVPTEAARVYIRHMSSRVLVLTGGLATGKTAVAREVVAAAAELGLFVAAIDLDWLDPRYARS